MAKKQDLRYWVEESLIALGGQGRIADVGRHIWSIYARELRKSGDLFFTWQYDMRWAADQLRRDQTMRAASMSPKGMWQLSGRRRKR
jgi:hypothetical protein